MFKYTKDVSDIWWQNWDRREALVLIDGKFYSGPNHQYAMEEYMQDYWTSRDYDLEDDSDMGEAIRYTDSLFAAGKIYGFDVFYGGYKNEYLISHYPNVLSDNEAMKAVLKFAKEKGYQIGSFTDETKLGNECYLVELVA